ncbi:wiskott-Aldrich syndrome protein-like [Xenia sp. Carnegie-2017]|uniref:wiskott-Aldrich syndrome protein-like n=1 Tax=Xenia sp. Carnegie-2017 TaxID=2897299 RepID=UPI001F034271|nr:wiskott-Aldrich syndrome protein-like [Xenia sp. Carnegie-2017]
MESVESLLLSSRENKVVTQILGKGRKVSTNSLATGVAQIFLALPSDRTQWTKLGTGVVCLVKDKQVKSFFIRFFDIKEKVLVWEQELYKQFKYRAVSKYFQTFFAHDCRAGINFSSADEAATFRAAVMERVNIFKKKREVARQKKLLAYQQQQQLNYQMQALQNSFFMPNMQSMMMMKMRAPLVAANQMQAMFNSMPPETRQVFWIT